MIFPGREKIMFLVNYEKKNPLIVWEKKQEKMGNNSALRDIALNLQQMLRTVSFQNLLTLAFDCVVYLFY
jgi:hypothetical protein